MSTIGYENWAVDLAEVGAIYPFRGTEVIMVIIALVLWVAWHRVQFKAEEREIEENGKDAGAPAADAIERY